MVEKINLPEPDIKKIKKNYKTIQKEFRKYERQTKETLQVSQNVLNRTITI